MNLENTGSSRAQGYYFLTIEADSYCSMNLKFFEKKVQVEKVNKKKVEKKVSIHTMTAG